MAEIRFTSGQCLGAASINHLMGLIQNAIIEKGYITTRILAAPQDLSSGRLEFFVLIGKVSRIQIDKTNLSQTYAFRIAAFQNEFPISNGDILNLKDIEQGLENLQRLPTVASRIQILPTAKPDENDILLHWQQRTIPYRVSFNFNNGGSKSTGKHQGSITLFADNLFGFSDLFSITYGKHLGKVNKQKDSHGRVIKSGTRNLAIHYSVPVGNWLWAFNYNSYRYHQAVAGFKEAYDYNGSSQSSNLGFTHLLYRDIKRKIHWSGKIWKLETRNYINDAEIKVQHRKIGGWLLSFDYQQKIANGTLALEVNYKRGTRLSGAFPPPEEAHNNGTGKMKVITANTEFELPFQLSKQHFRYKTTLRAQWNKTPLLAQDKFSIGGRYTVRGFDGEISLSAERGWNWRNEFIWHYYKQHQLYTALDFGRISGKSSKHQLGKTLAGSALGVRGEFSLGGNLSYDIFIGKALQKPEFFRTEKYNIGINISYTF
ncbi:ShlB/FhaC/HecB family hemolysin secretion/activation protein [[Haemophilus] felis]|nr:ShlB/FhaC/HecB family hemolysin secretion/activation protein [[Haemophilus] felis]